MASRVPWAVLQCLGEGYGSNRSRVLPAQGRKAGQLCIRLCPAWQRPSHQSPYQALQLETACLLFHQSCTGAGALAALAPAGSVQWIINDWDAYDAAWESAYAYLSNDDSDCDIDDDSWDWESDDDDDDDGHVGSGARIGSGQRRAGSPAKAHDVLLPWDT